MGIGIGDLLNKRKGTYFRRGRKLICSGKSRCRHVANPVVVKQCDFRLVGWMRDYNFYNEDLQLPFPPHLYHYKT